MKFNGVFVAMVTPYSDDGSSISSPRIREDVEFLLARGVHGLFALGTTGEWPLLSIEERLQATENLVSVVGKRVPLIVHCGANSTQTAVRLARHARDAEASAISLIAPSFYRLTDDALVGHFAVVAEAVPELPVFLYNIPSHTGNDITPAIAARVAARCSNVVGMKYSGDDFLRFRCYRKLLGSDFALFCGNDSFALPWLVEGADGLVSGNASAYPEVLVGLYESFRKASLRGAKRAQEVLDEIIEDRDAGSELSVFKNILACRGVSVGDVRPPLTRIGQDGLSVCLRQVEHLVDRGVLSTQ